MITIHSSLPQRGVAIHIPTINPIPVQARSQCHRQSDPRDGLLEAPRIQNRQLADHLLVIVQENHHISICLFRTASPRNEDALLDKIARAGEIDFEMPGGEVHGRQGVVGWKAATHDAHDEGEVGAEGRVHEARESLCVFRHCKPVIDARELYVFFEEDLARP